MTKSRYSPKAAAGDIRGYKETTFDVQNGSLEGISLSRNRSFQNVSAMLTIMVPAILLHSKADYRKTSVSTL